MPERAFTIAVPRVLYKEHAVRNYGYHGTSHRYVSAKAAQMLGIPYNKCALITAHLGNGCSIAAVLDGKCVDTSMGLTPCSGLVMGTRAGDVDGGLYPYLNSVMGWDIQKIYSMLNKESGILALSGLTHDMRTRVDASEEGHEGAILGIEVFCYTLAKKIAAYFVALGRTPDALIFTGGIGENSLPVREKTLSLLAPLGFVFDSNRNLDNGASSNGKVTSDKGIPGIVVATNEELLIAQDTEGVIKGA
jgi:acetate kinase